MQYSFIIPVYNCAAFLETCVASIQQVGIHDCEILLIDDGSTDGSGALCDRLEALYSGIRVIHKPNGGVSSARNRGIREAKGDYLLFLDADDSLDPAALSRVLSAAPLDHADMMIFGLTFDYYHRGRRYRRDPLFFDYNGTMPAEFWGGHYLLLFHQNALSSLCNKVFQREILVKYNLLLREDMFLYEDLEFVLRYMTHCGNIRNVPQAIYHYRQSEDEGNAGRRLARIDSIPGFLEPVEAAAKSLRESNPAISSENVEQMLLSLYLVLAREKISVSDLSGTRRICREFRLWRERLSLPISGEDKFQRHLLGEHAAILKFQDKKTALRHKIAVWVKASILRR